MKENWKKKQKIIELKIFKKQKKKERKKGEKRKKQE